MRPFLGKIFSSSQDFAHPDNITFRNEILQSIKGYKNVIVCSANEKNLQYYDHNGQHIIVSGSGTDISPLPNKTDALFSTTEKGFARLNFNTDGSVGLSFSVPENQDNNSDSFSREIIEPAIRIPKFERAYDLVDLPKSQMADGQYERGLVHRLVFGNVYRDDWSRSIKFQNLNLSKESGGLRPIKMGGGFTSTTLHLENRSGKRFVLRSVKKEVSRSVPQAFRNSFVQKIWQDQIAGSQPYAALAVPPLAEAAGVYHTNPKIFYVPKQKILGDFNSIFGDDIYLFEERPTGDHKDEESVVDSKKVISHSKMIKNIQKSPDHRIRQDQVLRSRLFDILLGDWDRHDDQWRWASFQETSNEKGKHDKITYYEPIPRDRDQVFYRVGGLGPWLAKFLVPEARKQQNFNAKINNVKYLGFQSRHFDKSFLNGQSEADWVNMAEELKALITDEVIDKAIGRLPEEIQALNKEHYKESLITRRNELPDYSSEYYRHLASYVDIVGTDKKELFEVTRHADNTVLISQFRNNKNNKNELIYERVFKAGETKEIRIYGLGGKDKIVLNGYQKNGPLIRVIGGKGEDTIIDQANRKGLKKGTWVYDSMDGNRFSLGSDTKDSRSDDSRLNQYDREEFYYDSPGGLLFFGYNPNDGFNVSARQVISKYGFQKKPFKARHSLNYGYAFGSSKLNLGYEFQLTDAFGKADFNLEAGLEIPNNVNHFFGLTNEFRFNIEDFDELEELDYFKYGQRRFYIKPAVQVKSDNKFHDLKIGPYYEYSKLLENEDKFVGDPSLSQLDPINFETKNFVGIDVDYSFTNLDDRIYPTLGMVFKMNTSYNLNTLYTEESFVRIKGDLTFYNLIWLPKPLVWASKISAGTIYGDFSFFQANFAGFDEGLRAYRQNRFGGKSSFIFSNDLRLKLFNVHGSSLPFSIGIMAAYDSGRVWNQNESSNSWHNSYGGGLWFNFLDIMPLSVYYMTSKDDESSLIIKTGFGF